MKTPQAHPSGAIWRSAMGAGFSSVALAVIAMVIFAGVSRPQVPDNAYVKIVNLRSGLRADVIWASTNPYQGVFLWPNNSSASQEFLREEQGNGHFTLRARHSLQCLMLDWRDGGYTNGTKIIQYPYCYGGYLPAEWYFGFVLDGCDQRLSDCNLLQRMILVNAYTHKCLDAGNSAGGAPGQEAVLQQWDCISSINDWNAGNQLWTEVWAH